MIIQIMSIYSTITLKPKTFSLYSITGQQKQIQDTAFYKQLKFSLARKFKHKKISDFICSIKGARSQCWIKGRNALKVMVHSIYSYLTITCLSFCQGDGSQ